MRPDHPGTRPDRHRPGLTAAAAAGRAEASCHHGILRRPATGDRRPATGDRRPATGDRRPATGACAPPHPATPRGGPQQPLRLV
ncbi:hypothetical protein Sfr7A_14110 [Streptomyces xinghaiensis]|uniref:Uncharacterized protein n=1 Tax=Streptomyces xinghaiensis TaxID=1038928 RepID=A0A3R7FIT4_9ACTN|nr:hypothetical protein Sfr7A_14110 [Streptomyces xinghaiensis]RKM98000.1 hypothetical protein SFRA_005545 [Streptomyces xinghaiensis]RNC73862.1 hypothetical protein DC095_013430 [Streptomyces xinghaiensis]